MLLSILSLFDFLIKMLATVSDRKSKNLKVIERDKALHSATQFSMLIQNIIVLLHHNLVLIMKIGIDKRNFR